MGDVSYLEQIIVGITGPIVYGWELLFVCYTWNGDAGKQFGWFSFPELAAVGGASSASDRGRRPTSRGRLRNLFGNIQSPR